MSKTWQEADEICQREGGRLASPSTNAKYDFIVSKVQSLGRNYYWIGGTRPAASKSKNGWKWINGENVSVDGWWPGRPDGPGLCLFFIYQPYPLYGWADSRCSYKRHFICEVSTNTGK